MDFIESGNLATDSVKFFVLDEADRLLDHSNQDVILKMFNKFPKAATGTQRLQVSCSIWLHALPGRAASGSRRDKLGTQRLRVSQPHVRPRQGTLRRTAPRMTAGKLTARDVLAADSGHMPPLWQRSVRLLLLCHIRSAASNQL